MLVVAEEDTEVAAAASEVAAVDVTTEETTADLDTVAAEADHPLPEEKREDTHPEAREAPTAARGSERLS